MLRTFLKHQCLVKSADSTSVTGFHVWSRHVKDDDDDDGDIYVQLGHKRHTSTMRGRGKKVDNNSLI